MARISEPGRRLLCVTPLVHALLVCIIHHFVTLPSSQLNQILIFLVHAKAKAAQDFIGTFWRIQAAEPERADGLDGFCQVIH
jgi:hypothetical protein